MHSKNNMTFTPSTLSWHSAWMFILQSLHLSPCLVFPFIIWLQTSHEVMFLKVYSANWWWVSRTGGGSTLTLKVKNFKNQNNPRQQPTLPFFQCTNFVQNANLKIVKRHMKDKHGRREYHMNQSSDHARTHRLRSLAPARGLHLVVALLAALHILESVHPLAFDSSGHLGTEIDRILHKEDKGVAYICILQSTLSLRLDTDNKCSN